MMIAAGELAERLHTVTCGVVRPPDRLPIDRWAEAHRRIATDGSGSKAQTPLSFDETPQFREILRAAADPVVREIVVPKSTQTGFTEAVLHTIALHTVVERPRTLMFLQPSQDIARDFNKSKLGPAIDGCDAAVRKIAPGDKRSVATSDRRQFVDCHMLIKYAGGGSQLRMETVHTAMLDEVDAYPVDAGTDPIESVRSRQGAIDNALTLMGSSPVFGGRILDAYQACDVRHIYQTPCPKCGQFFELFDFDLVRWVGGFDVDPAEAVATTHVRCPSCSTDKKQTRIRESAKRWMMLNGVWTTQSEHVESDGSITETYDRDMHRPFDGAPVCSHYPADFFRERGQAARPADRDAEMSERDADAVCERLGVRVVGVRTAGRSHGFIYNSLQSILYKEGWSGLVKQYVKARGRLPNTWHGERLTRFPPRSLRSAKQEDVRMLCVPGRETGVVPAWAVYVGTGVDIQIDCVKVITWAYGPRLSQSAVIETAVIPRHEDGNLLEPEIIAYLSGLRPRIEDTEDTAVPVFAIDTGHFTLDAYGLVDRLRRAIGPSVPHRDNAGVWPVKGENRQHDSKVYRIGSRREARMPGTGKRITGIEISDLVLVNTGMLKDEILGRMNPEKPGEYALDPVELPDSGLWLDAFDPENGPGADDVIAELVNEKKIRAGAGTGLPGKLGRGVERDEWVKVNRDKPNDFFDGSVYPRAIASMYGIDHMEPDDTSGGG